MTDRIDVDEVVGRIDVNAVLGRIDVDQLLGRIDVDQLLGRIDVNSLLDRIDLTALLARIDVDEIVERIDVDRLVQRADLAGIVTKSTRGITAKTLDLVRRQIAGIDHIVTRFAAHIVRRDPDHDPAAPGALEGVSPPSVPDHDRPSITGNYAGPLARAGAFGLDWFIIVSLFGVATAGVRWIISLFTNVDTSQPMLGPVWAAALFGLWTSVYFGVSLVLTGRTVGKAVIGLRVVRTTGQPVRPWQALLRVLALPLSFALLGLGLIGAVFGRRRRTLHDVIAGTAEVIDWGDRPAALPSPLGRWLTHRQEPAQAS